MTYTDYLYWQSCALPAQTPEAFVVSGEPGPDRNEMTCIWRLAHANSMADLLALTGLRPAAFSRAYGLPLRTVQDWKAGLRTPPESVRNLLAFAVFSTLCGKQKKVQEKA